MQEPLKAGDLCMVVRDTTNPVGDRCHRKLVSYVFTVTETWGPVCSMQEPIVCPACKTRLPFLFAEDLQKLRGPRASDRRLHNVNEDGHGWRLVETEVAA